MWSKIDIEDGEALAEDEGVGNGLPAAAISDRPWSFPEPKKEDVSVLDCA